jgi:hypothetical protein
LPTYIQMFGLSRDVVKPGAWLEEIIDHRKTVGPFVGDPQEYCDGIRRAIGSGQTYPQIVKGTDGHTTLSQPLRRGRASTLSSVPRTLLLLHVVFFRWFDRHASGSRYLLLLTRAAHCG